MNIYLSRQAGFTLVELVVIMLVLGILSAYVAPKFFSLDDYRSRAAYDELAGALRYAQKLAVATGCEVQVAVAGNNYALQQHSTDCTTGVFATIVNHPVTTNNLEGVTLSSTTTPFIFNALGSCSASPTIEVKVAGVTTHTINVVQETGFVDAP